MSQVRSAGNNTQAQWRLSAKILSPCALEKSKWVFTYLCFKKGKWNVCKISFTMYLVHHCCQTNWSVGKHHSSKIQSTSGHLLQSQRLLQFFLLTTNSAPVRAAASWFKLPMGCLKWACAFLHLACCYSWFLCSLWTTSLLRNSPLQSSSGVGGSWTALHGAFELCLLSTALRMAKKREPEVSAVISLKSFLCKG